jgi:hypothetical protein
MAVQVRLPHVKQATDSASQGFDFSFKIYLQVLMGESNVVNGAHPREQSLAVVLKP